MTKLSKLEEEMFFAIHGFGLPSDPDIANMEHNDHLKSEAKAAAQVVLRYVSKAVHDLSGFVVTNQEFENWLSENGLTPSEWTQMKETFPPAKIDVRIKFRNGDVVIGYLCPCCENEFRDSVTGGAISDFPCEWQPLKEEELKTAASEMGRKTTAGIIASNGLQNPEFEVKI